MTMETTTQTELLPEVQEFLNKEPHGAVIGGVEVENQTNYGLMTYMHHEKQYIVLQTGPKLTALALYEDEVETNEH